MPRITFVRDVLAEDGTTVVYDAGYAADVSHDVATAFVRAGDAIIGDAQPKPVKRKVETRSTSIKATDLSNTVVKPSK